MSSFIVSDITIHRIISGFDAPIMFTSFPDFRRALTDKLKTVGYDFDLAMNNKEFAELRNRFGTHLLMLNGEAVYCRYGEESRETYEYEFSHVTVSKFQFLKSLQCYLYQCMEGPIPETSLYKALEKIVDLLKGQIIDELPGYQEAVWG